MEQTSKGPTIRRRATHKKTAARGWEVDETAVEITYDLADLAFSGDPGEFIARLQVNEMQLTYQLAWEEAQRRNIAEGRL